MNPPRRADGDGISALGREFASLFCIFRTSSAPSSAVAMVDVYGAASDVGLNCAIGCNIVGETPQAE